MIPISDDNPSRLWPVITWSLILGCIGVYAWEVSLGREMDAAIAVFGFTPAALLKGYVPIPDVGPLPAGFTILSSMFMHASLLHIAGNMLYLWIFGNNVEDGMGHLRYLVFYFVCGAAAALTLAYIDPASRVPMVGASGAISGVLAAYVMLFPRARVLVIVPLGIIFYPFRIAAIWVVGFWFLLQLFSAAATRPDQPGVAFWAHVGGFLAGIVLTPFFKSSDFPLFGPVRRRGPWG